jgi:hypothetical protein
MFCSAFDSLDREMMWKIPEPLDTVIVKSTPILFLFAIQATRNGASVNQLQQVPP